MIVYFTGDTFYQTINNVIKDLNEIVMTKEVSNDFDFLKYIKQSITSLESVDMLIIDISVCINNDDEIINALEMIRTIYDDLRIIVFAPYRATGDDLLTRCFNIGILNIINTDDFLDIKNELIKCITTGKSFKDAIKYKDVNTEQVIEKREIKKTVNRQMIGIVGSEPNIGVTHNAIVLANYLRKKGYLVAIAEMNLSGDFERILIEYQEKEYEDGYYTLNGIDYYKNCNENKLVQILEGSYNFVLLDFGYIENADMITYERCDRKIIIAGSKPWEYQNLHNIFDLYKEKKNLLKLIFCFNLTPKSDHAQIREGMPDIKNVHFLNYTEDPFTNDNFVDAEIIFKDYLPDKTEVEKKKFSLFGSGGKKNEAEKREKNSLRGIFGSKQSANTH